MNWIIQSLFLPTLLGRETDGKSRPALLADTTNGDFAIRRGGWKLIKLMPNARIGLEQVAYELYEINQDPYETTNDADQ